jgi:hypothetical protein
MKPIYWTLNVTMLYRIIMNIIHVPSPILIIPEKMFPETPLPDLLLAPLIHRMIEPA